MEIMIIIIVSQKIHFQDMDDLQLNDVADDGNNNNNNNNITSVKNEFILVHQRNFFGQIKSFEFICHIICINANVKSKYVSWLCC